VPVVQCVLLFVVAEQLLLLLVAQLLLLERPVQLDSLPVVQAL
jgi:hypothetical protein